MYTCPARCQFPLSIVILVGEYTVIEGGQNPWLGWMEIYALDSLTPREQLLLLRTVSCPSFARPLSDHGVFALELLVGCLKAFSSPEFPRTAFSTASGCLWEPTLTSKRMMAGKLVNSMYLGGSWPR